MVSWRFTTVQKFRVPGAVRCNKKERTRAAEIVGRIKARFPFRNKTLDHQRGGMPRRKIGLYGSRVIQKISFGIKERIRDPVVKVAAITLFAVRRRSHSRYMQADIVQQMRIDRIKQAQDEECWMSDLKTYLIGEASNLTAERQRQLHQTRRWIKLDCYISVPYQKLNWKIVWIQSVWYFQICCKKISCIITTQV